MALEVCKAQPGQATLAGMQVGLDSGPLFWGEGVELRLEGFAPGEDLGAGEAA